MASSSCARTVGVAGSTPGERPLGEVSVGDLDEEEDDGRKEQEEADGAAPLVRSREQPQLAACPRERQQVGHGRRPRSAGCQRLVGGCIAKDLYSYTDRPASARLWASLVMGRGVCGADAWQSAWGWLLREPLA